MTGRKMSPERVQVLRDLLAAGMTPNRAAGIAGVSKSFACVLDQKAAGAGRLAAERVAAAPREAERAARGHGRKVAPERERALLDLLAAGMNPNQAAPAAGVPRGCACAVHHEMGGVYRPPGVTYSARYPDREERYEMARLRESGLSVRQVAGRLGRSASAVSRELGRNAGPHGCQPERAERLAWERQRRPKPSRLSGSPVLRAAVQHLLDRRHSPGQASGRLKIMHPDDPAMRVSHETICQSICLYPRGELRRELKAFWPRGMRGRRDRRGSGD